MRNPFLQGYLLGNAETTRTEDNYQILFAHGMGLISDELYQSLQKNCKGEYIKDHTRTALCSRDLKSFDEMISGLYKPHILEPNCEFGSPKPLKASWRRSITENYPLKFVSDTRLGLPPLSCRSYAYSLSGYWSNDDNAQKAEQKRNGNAAPLNIPNKEDIPSSFPYHVKLSRKGYRSLIYNGDHDMYTPFMATQAWIRSLNYSIVNGWRPWYTNGQVAGYTRTYFNVMTFATVKGGGHTAPEFKPEECFYMYSRWISNRPL
ncbi:hypothetical protein PIB30_022996 [Stylosanthes scabra]|uniref:Uncharacterized protein n=1 Tax=Stylosanthes scabra TaxID=79078 RepID=A0ABU6U9A9_9FABA|nr:hypothetical protein [Stylosanthes scabra]